MGDALQQAYNWALRPGQPESLIGAIRELD